MIDVIKFKVKWAILKMLIYLCIFRKNYDKANELMRCQFQMLERNVVQKEE